ncbi:hypothetical protein HYC85_004920 [Camellia sinensis]|uniref:Clp ATPase C-terminal domain-containing protein n=1 Tax=Camellia sinensis TaxID=4442 RepID=A0A7J7HYY2_CAMSI|nr:hypothetical protein HYC85_004920 [Camellia sinensis]
MDPLGGTMLSLSRKYSRGMGPDRMMMKYEIATMLVTAVIDDFSYDGHEEGGQLITEAVRRQPYSVRKHFKPEFLNRPDKIVEYGVRPIRRWVEQNVVKKLSGMLLNKEIDENSTELTYRVKSNGGLVNAATGQNSDILIELTDAAKAEMKMKLATKMKKSIDDSQNKRKLLTVGCFPAAAAAAAFLILLSFGAEWCASCRKCVLTRVKSGFSVMV